MTRYLSHFRRRWIRPLVPRRALRGYARYLSDWRRYRALAGAEPTGFLDSYPCLFDRAETTPVDAHYFHQAVWAFELIRASAEPHHVDVGSDVLFVGLLSAQTRVTFVDLRPLTVELPNLDCRRGDILQLPFDDGSLRSLSCLHVAEHIGLGRYGDRLDPQGTRKAARELSRVLATGGQLYLSLPVGRPRVCFNAHRIHAPGTVREYFAGLELVEFAGVDDRKRFRRQLGLEDLASEAYACGMFHFAKP